VEWKSAVALWAKLKNTWEWVLSGLAILFAIGCFLCIPWLIYDVSVHPAERARVGHSLLRSIEWGAAGWVITKIWNKFSPKKEKNNGVHGEKVHRGKPKDRR
jgi:hypothetical protein